MRLPEGDQERFVPEWRRKLDAQNQGYGFMDIKGRHLEKQYISKTEVTLKHPDNKSVVRIKDDGGIDLFAGDMLGISIDPSTKSVNLFGDNINLFGKKVNLRSNHDGLTWNGFHFNPELYMETSTARDPYLNGTKEYWVHNEEQGWHWETGSWAVKPMVRSQSRTEYSEGMVGIMKSLGLPAE